MGFTVFSSDEGDKAKHVWNKVFLNLQDYGKLFDHGKDAVPNPYGAILIRLAPEALECVRNVAVCLRSASARGFKRKREALTLEQTERIFKSPGSATIKPPWELREEFVDAQSPELSCKVDGEVLRFANEAGCLVEEVKVDPCHTGYVSLKEIVRDFALGFRRGGASGGEDGSEGVPRPLSDCCRRATRGTTKTHGSGHRWGTVPARCFGACQDTQVGTELVGEAEDATPVPAVCPLLD